MCSTSLAESDRKRRKAANQLGDPIKFATKILAVQSAQLNSPSDSVFVAEAGGVISALRLSSNEAHAGPRGPQAPLTSLAFHTAPATTGSSTVTTIYAGCWDKSIWRYPLQDNKIAAPTSFPAHTDFVKCLLVVPTPDRQHILMSGGADGDIRLWSLDGRPLGFIKPGARGIECLALDPLSSPDAPVVFASTSKQEIFSFVVPSLSEIATFRFELAGPIVAHATSVYKLHFDDDGDMWTASADKTAKHLLRADGWKTESTLVHPDFVRDVVTHGKYGWVVTACRDENVRVWNAATGDLHHVFSGHYEEVTGLALVNDMIISVSIDATLRRWSLDPVDLRQAIEKAKSSSLLQQEPEPPSDLGMLTEQEEAELRALMEAEEEDTLEKMALDAQ
jgi:WD40 repeat protein